MIYLEDEMGMELPMEFSRVETYDQFLMIDVTGISKLTGMVRNISPYPSPVQIQMRKGGDAPPQATDENPESEKTMNFTVGVVGWVLFGIAAVCAVVVTYLFCKNRGISNDSQ